MRLQDLVTGERAEYAAACSMPSSRLLTLVAGLAFASFPGNAFADAGVAEALFNQGKALMEQGKFTEACAKFDESYAQDVALGTLLNLANCREQEGRIAEAAALFGDAVGMAKRLGDDRAAYADERRNALEPRLPTLTVNVTNPVEGLKLYKGKKELGTGAYGVALPVDPGETTLLLVDKDEDVLWQTSVRLEESKSAKVDVDMRKIFDSAPLVKQKLAQAKVKEGGGKSGDAAPVEFWNPMRITGLATLGLGVAGVGTGFVLGGLALGKKGQSDDLCVDPAGGDTTLYCTTKGRQLIDDARTFGDASTWTLVGSGVVAGVGLTLFIVAPSGASELEERSDIPLIVPWVSPDRVGFSAVGSF